MLSRILLIGLNLLIDQILLLGSLLLKWLDVYTTFILDSKQSLLFFSHAKDNSLGLRISLNALLITLVRSRHVPVNVIRNCTWRSPYCQCYWHKKVDREDWKNYSLNFAPEHVLFHLLFVLPHIWNANCSVEVSDYGGVKVTHWVENEQKWEKSVCDGYWDIYHDLVQ